MVVALPATAAILALAFHIINVALDQRPIALCNFQEFASRMFLP